MEEHDSEEVARSKLSITRHKHLNKLWFCLCLGPRVLGNCPLCSYTNAEPHWAVPRWHVKSIVTKGGLRKMLHFSSRSPVHAQMMELCVCSRGGIYLLHVSWVSAMCWDSPWPWEWGDCIHFYKDHSENWSNDQNNIGAKMCALCCHLCWSKLGFLNLKGSSNGHLGVEMAVRRSEEPELTRTQTAAGGKVPTLYLSVHWRPSWVVSSTHVGHSQLTVTPAPGHWVPSSPSAATCTYIAHLHTDAYTYK